MTEETELTSVPAAVAAAVAWLGGDGGIEDLERQTLKAGEEHGEAVEAWIGTLGSNPRKGHTHTPVDVVGELADVAFTALVGLASRGVAAAEVLHRALEQAGGGAPATSNREITRRLLTVQVAGGRAAEAVLNDADVDGSLEELVATALTAIVTLGFDPVPVQVANAHKVLARIAGMPVGHLHE